LPAHERRRLKPFLDRQRRSPRNTLFVNVFGRYVEVVTHSLSPDTNPNKFAPNPLPFGSPTWQSTGCSVPSDVGKQTLVPYTADYYFFTGTNDESLFWHRSFVSTPNGDAG
jgi:hypothetical protein